MFSQIICVAAVVAFVSADLYADRDNYYGRGRGYYGDDHYQDIDYKFKYVVRDDQTYNYQTRDEEKDGKTVRGSYSLVEPDGSTRIVKYTADEYGFHAQVDNDKSETSYGQDYKSSHYYRPSYDKKPSYSQQSVYPVPSYAPKYKSY
uniref:Uncharacterized protein n=1 Tax=Strigamia maritima TaxID=126957 RepID=T1ILI0_STRMM